MNLLTRKKQQLGLTLVEVLMALAIMGIGVTGLVASASRCLAVVRKAKNYENARRLLGEVEIKLQEHLLEQEEAGDELEEESESWSLNPPYNHYTGTWSLVPVGEDEDSETAGLFELRMRIAWANHGKESYEEITSYLFSPKPTSGGSVVGQ